MVRPRRVAGRRPGRPRPARRPTSPSCPTTCSHAVLDLLAGRYPSEEFAELRPRIVWDRVAGVVRGRAGAQRLAVTSGGTIPDRGLFGVFLPDGTRVGELDEEMVYESRPGETFLLGASTWRIEDITHERVIVTPGAGPARARCRSGTATARAGRSSWAGPSARSSARSASAARDAARPRCATRHGLDALGRRQPRSRYLDEQAEATGARARRPHDRRRALPRRDRRLAGVRPLARSAPRSTPRGPWPCRPGWPSGGASTSSCIWSDDGIVLRLPEAVDELPLDELLIDPDEIDELVVGPAARHRAVRLPLPRVRGPGPAAAPPPARPAHAAVAAAPAGGRPAGGGRPLPDVPDPARDHPRVPQRRVRPARPARGAGRPALAARCGSSPSTPARPRRSPSRCCSAGSPSTCTRATPRWPSAGPPPWPSTATCCATCSAPRSCASCSTPTCWPTSSSSCSAWPTAAGPATPTRCHDLLRALGPLTLAELDARRSSRRRGRAAVARRAGRPPPRAIRGRSPGEERFAAAEDAARLRDALGVAAAAGPAPAPSPSPVERPLVDLVARFARTHGPFLTAHVRPPPRRAASSRCGCALEALEAEGRVVRGEFRPDGVEREWCDDDVLRQLRRRSLAALRREVEPVDADGPGPLPARRGRASASPPARASTALVEVLGAAAGRGAAGVGARGRRPRRPGSPATARPTSTRCAPPARWCGSAPAPSAPTDGRVRLALPRPGLGLLVPRRRATSRPTARSTTALLAHLAQRGASFWPDLVAAVGRRRACPTTTPTVLAALWDLVWAGRGHQRLAGPAAGLRWPAAASRRRGRSRRPRAGRARAGSPASARRPAPAGGRWSAPLLEPARRRRPRRPTPGPASCSSATACSPARRRWPRASRAASPASTRCSRRWRSGARCGGATSSPASAPPSSPCPAPSTGCASFRRRVDRRPTPSGAGRRARRHRPGPALRRRPAAGPRPTGRPPGPQPPAPTSCWSTASPSPTSSGAAAPGRPSRAAAERPDWPDGPGRRWSKDGRLPPPRDRQGRRRARPRAPDRRRACAPPASSTATRASSAAPEPIL